ncbi:MAG: type II toxin-antitoxin system RelE/ParE family toxin [Bacteroidota bacterium]|nr:type II toxin-antitoxin system RelE/ParE family toxin [Bacteroidota bacterium]
MEIEFLEKFSRDLDRLVDVSTKIAVRKAITSIQQAHSLNEISNIKKLRGYKTAFRIRIGDYRIGLFVEGDVVQFARIVHRKDI